MNPKHTKMNKIVYKLVFNRKKKLNAQGTALVQVEAYQDRQRKYFSTHVYLSPHQWDTRRQQVRNHPNADALNYRLRQMVTELERKELQLWRRGHPVTLALLKENWDAQPDTRSFTDFFAREVQNADVKESTRRNLASTLQLLRSFRRRIAFAELTFDLVADFELFLRRRGCHANTVAKHIRHLRRQVNIAVNKGCLEPRLHPFRNYRIKTVPGRHTHLTPEELERLERCGCATGNARQRHVLDAFLFCCYAGLRYSDFTHLTAGSLVSVGKERWLTYRSVKTGADVRLPLSLLFDGKGLAILHKYRACLDDFFHLPDNSNVNKCLRRLALRAGIDKPVSFHVARHTNATLLIYKGVNITTVQRLLGHKSVRTTQVYANIMDLTIVHDLKSHRK